MNIESRILIRVALPDVLAALGIEGADSERAELDKLVDRLMGRNPEARFQFIQERAQFVEDIDI